MQYIPQCQLLKVIYFYWYFVFFSPCNFLVCSVLLLHRVAFRICITLTCQKKISSLPSTLGAAESSLLLLTDGVTQSSLPVAQGIINTSLPLCPWLKVYYLLQKILLVSKFVKFFFMKWVGLVILWIQQNNFVRFIVHIRSNKYLCKNWEILWFESLVFYYLLLVCSNYYFGKVS